MLHLSLSENDDSTILSRTYLNLSGSRKYSSQIGLHAVTFGEFL